MKPALIVMAAGIGSRYGGLKQIDPIGPSGEIILDYSVYDAIRAGFNKVVFLINRSIEAAFRQKIGRAVEQQVDTAYVFQDLTALPPGFNVPEGRVKPWGTGHAVLSCRNAISGPFAVINADDFYGASAFEALEKQLSQVDAGAATYSMVGYRLRNTLSENGYVARGVCSVSPQGLLQNIHERTRIESFPDGIKFTENGSDWVTLPPDTPVSMNSWGLTPTLFAELEARFPLFLQRSTNNPLKAEFFLPNVIGELLEEGKAQVQVLPTHEKWFGVTYPQDRPVVQQALQNLIQRGVYPAQLWKNR